MPARVVGRRKGLTRGLSLFRGSSLWAQAGFLLSHGQSPLRLMRTLLSVTAEFEVGRLGREEALGELSLGGSYSGATRRLAPGLALEVRSVPKAYRKLFGSKFTTRPSHVAQEHRQRALFRRASLAVGGREPRGLRSRLLWVLADLGQPGLGSRLVSQKAEVYKEVVRRLKRRV